MVKKWPYPNLHCTLDTSTKYDLYDWKTYRSKFIHACNEHIISSTAYYKCSKPCIHKCSKMSISTHTQISVQPLSSAHLEPKTSAFYYQIYVDYDQYKTAAFRVIMINYMSCVISIKKKIIFHCVCYFVSLLAIIIITIWFVSIYLCFPSRFNQQHTDHGKHSLLKSLFLSIIWRDVWNIKYCRHYNSGT